MARDPLVRTLWAFPFPCKASAFDQPTQEAFRVDAETKNTINADSVDEFWKKTSFVIQEQAKSGAYLVPEPAVEMVGPELPEPRVPAVDSPGSGACLIIAITQAKCWT